MKSLIGRMSWFVALLCAAAPCHAGLILTIGNGTFAQDSGVQSLDVVARSDNAAVDSVVGLTADFQLQAGAFSSPPGLFGQAGMIGAGNLNAASSFTRDAGDFKIASLSLDFNSGQLFPASDQSLASLIFNVDGLTAGTYTVTFLDITANAGAIAATGNAGSFTITPTAIPEPSSIALLSVIGVVVLGGQRLVQKRRRTKLTVE